MSDKFYTKVKASKGFWEKFMAKQLEAGTPFNLSNNISDELIITSTGKTALDEIIKLSADYPEELFRVKTEANDAYNNYVHLYECSRGKSILIKEGYEYYFKFNISNLERIDPAELGEFKHKAICFFRKNQNFLPKDIKIDIDETDYEGRNKWSAAFTYETKDVRLTATKKSLTCINIDVKFPDYDELPF